MTIQRIYSVSQLVCTFLCFTARPSQADFQFPASPWTRIVRSFLMTSICLLILWHIAYFENPASIFVWGTSMTLNVTVCLLWYFLTGPVSHTTRGWWCQCSHSNHTCWYSANRTSNLYVKDSSEDNMFGIKLYNVYMLWLSRLRQLDSFGAMTFYGFIEHVCNCYILMLSTSSSKHGSGAIQYTVGRNKVFSITQPETLSLWQTVQLWFVMHFFLSIA